MLEQDCIVRQVADIAAVAGTLVLFHGRVHVHGHALLHNCIVDYEVLDRVAGTGLEALVLGRVLDRLEAVEEEPGTWELAEGAVVDELGQPWRGH